jgi:hypothetical protein
MTVTKAKLASLAEMTSFIAAINPRSPIEPATGKQDAFDLLPYLASIPSKQS